MKQRVEKNETKKRFFQYNNKRKMTKEGKNIIVNK